MSKNISRYKTPSGAEAEFEPGSRGRVLRNLKGITRKCDMDKLEFDALVRVQDAYLKKIESDTVFTVGLLRQMHKDCPIGWVDSMNGPENIARWN